MKILIFFDYIFYRTYCFFCAKNNDDPEENATNLVGILQGFVFFDLFLIISTIFDFEIPQKYYPKYLLGIPLALILFILNHYRYKRKLKKDDYNELHKKWANEPDEIKRRNGWLIVFFIFFIIFGVIGLMISINVLFKNT